MVGSYPEPVDLEGDCYEGLTIRLIERLQGRAARATPARVETHRHGWWLRHTEMSMWWAGSVLAHGPDPAFGLAESIMAAEDFYAAHRAVARFQVCPACPVGLDAALADRGYRRQSPMSLFVADTGRVLESVTSSSYGVQVSERYDDAWLALWASVHAQEADLADERRILDLVQQHSVYATAFFGDEPVAAGRAVADTGWVGIFAMATLPRMRGKGVGTAVLAALVGWAEDQRASGVYLQVERHNPAARRLYARAGFVEACSYHYRAAPSRQPRLSAAS